MYVYIYIYTASCSLHIYVYMFTYSTMALPTTKKLRHERSLHSRTKPQFHDLSWVMGNPTSISVSPLCFKNKTTHETRSTHQECSGLKSEMPFASPFVVKPPHQELPAPDNRTRGRPLGACGKNMGLAAGAISISTKRSQTHVHSFECLKTFKDRWARWGHGHVPATLRAMVGQFNLSITC